MAELDLGFVDTAFDRRRARRRRRAGQRDVTLTGQQARGGVEPDPSCPRQIDLAPGVQVGEIDRGAARAVERLDVRHELNQVARHETYRQAATAQQLHQQPGRIAARPRAVGQCFFRRLHAGFHADQVLDVALHHLVDIDQEVDAAALGVVELCKVRLDQWRRAFGDEVRRQFFSQRGRVLERVVLGGRLQEKVEGVVDRHFDDQVDRDLELAGFLGEHQARLVICEGILLPVDEMIGRFNAQRVRNDVAAAVRCRSQTNDLRSQLHRTVVLVMGDVVECSVNGHVCFERRQGGFSWHDTSREAKAINAPLALV